MDKGEIQELMDKKITYDGGVVALQKQGNEAGPELVGTIGSRSAVVNNNQIVESVSHGVYDAVRAAMSGKKAEKNSSLEVNLYLDGKQITTAVERVQKERGLSLMSGGVAYGF